MADKDEEKKAEKGGKEGQAQPSVEGAEQAPGNDYDEMKERMMRIAAEFDNYKKRTKADLESARSLGRAEAVKGMLPVLDEFELAMLSMEKADPSLAKGVEMIFSNMVGALSAMGLKEVKADGMYDPYMHEPVLTMESEKKPGTILQVTKKGYTLNGMLLRPASVIIAGEKKAVAQEPAGGEGIDSSKNAKN